MSPKKNIAVVPTKKAYADTLKDFPNDATLSNAQPIGVYTRRMAKKTIVSDAAASLRSAHIPTRPRKISAASIAATATAIIEAASPPQKRGEESREWKCFFSWIERSVAKKS
ncbi:hypothetical protein vseg_013536 [Gypsophila vaccaria]